MGGLICSGQDFGEHEEAKYLSSNLVPKGLGHEVGWLSAYTTVPKDIFFLYKYHR